MLTPGPESAERMEWQVCLAAKRPLLTIGLIGFCLALSYLAIVIMQGAWWGFATLAALAGALADYWFPAQYELTERYVKVDGLGRRVKRDWEAFRVAVVLPDRIVLSPLTKVDSWVARRRSVTLMLGDNRDEVVAFVEHHVPLQG